MTCKSCEVKTEDKSVIEKLEEGKKRFSFPKDGIIIVAENLEEAEKQLEEIKSKK